MPKFKIHLLITCTLILIILNDIQMIKIKRNLNQKPFTNRSLIEEDSQSKKTTEFEGNEKYESLRENDDDEDDDEEEEVESSSRTDKERREEKSNKGPKIWDQWGKWSPCSVTCGIGKIIRWRHCVGGGCAAGEKEAQIKTCTLPAC